MKSTDHIGMKQSLTVLAIDTSTAVIACALTEGDNVLAQIQSLAERNHSVHAVIHLQELMEQSQKNKDQLDVIAVGHGPGSYTGMRIAVTAAKTLAWAWDKPLIGISSLEAVAYGGWQSGLAQAAALDGGPISKLQIRKPQDDEEHWILPVMDARRGQIYGAAFSGHSDGKWNRIKEDGVLLMKDWVDVILSNLKDYKENKAIHIWVVGELSMHMEQAGRLQTEAEGVDISVTVTIMPYVLHGYWVAELARKKLAGGQHYYTGADIHTFTPNYTQLTEAEVKLKEKQAQERSGESC